MLEAIRFLPLELPWKSLPTTTDKTCRDSRAPKGSPTARAFLLNGLLPKLCTFIDESNAGFMQMGHDRHIFEGAS